MILLHTEVRWLSRGHSLSQVFEPHNEIEHFLSEEFKNHKFVLAIGYLSDIFSILNALNVNLQGKSVGNHNRRK